MAVPDISGGWLSRGQRIYTILQLDDKLLWHVVHRNGVMETGIGSFVKENEKEASTTVEVRWNFHGGNVRAAVRGCRGKVIIVEGKASEIHWADRDDFRRVP